MKQFNPQTKIPPSVLATDLDGTLIPLDGYPENIAALNELAELYQAGGFKLVYATGRHYESVMDACDVFNLPLPDWLICDVGTSIFKSDCEKREFSAYLPYREQLMKLTGGFDRTHVEALLSGVSSIELQSSERQQEFKISYTCNSGRTHSLVEEMNQTLGKHNYPYQCTGSVDPFEHCGLLDVLPEGVSKAYALIWLSSHADFLPEEVVFAGDSGNDQAALTCGFRAILVGNASDALAEAVRDIFIKKGCESLLYRANGTATSGVLEGCKHFGLF